MQQNAPRWMQNAVKDIRKTYGFLFESGYDAFSVDLIDMGRQVTLRKQDVLVRIAESHGEEIISFRKEIPPPDEFTDIGSVIYAAMGVKIPPWESNNPKVLAQYLDRIEAYFGGEYVKNKDGLRTAQEEYYAGFSQGGVVVPLEPEFIPSPPPSKIIPILYYPWESSLCSWRSAPCFYFGGRERRVEITSARHGSQTPVIRFTRCKRYGDPLP